jgi:hypothetical protein
VLYLIEELRELVDALDRAGVELAVCGGLAVAIDARPRATLGVDLLLPAASLPRAKASEREAATHGAAPAALPLAAPQARRSPRG